MKSNIEHEAENCRSAFKNIKIGSVVQHCHHELWLEILQEPPENRIDYILTSKAQYEMEERLRRFRPLAVADRQKAVADRQKAVADRQKAYADWQKADADRQKAYADWQKAYADWQKASTSPAMVALHAEICGCAWSATTDIFGNKR